MRGKGIILHYLLKVQNDCSRKGSKLYSLKLLTTLLSNWVELDYYRNNSYQQRNIIWHLHLKFPIMHFLKNTPHYNHFSGEGTRHWDTKNNYQHVVPATNDIYCIWTFVLLPSDGQKLVLLFESSVPWSLGPMLKKNRYIIITLLEIILTIIKVN